ncbi:hypothetical protein [Bdellovibrio sp. BCCA]|uniref:hypothetical protein n=1 Tax=Bdellovibrio sp. BCCA TaxID=3136281 RepID=UPI0030F10AB3
MLKNLGVNTKDLRASIELLTLDVNKRVICRGRDVSIKEILAEAHERIEEMAKKKDRAISNFSMIEKIANKSNDVEVKQVSDRISSGVQKVLNATNEIIKRYMDSARKHVAEISVLSGDDEIQGLKTYADMLTNHLPGVFNCFGEGQTHITNQFSDPIARNISHALLSDLAEYSVALEMFLDCKIALDVEVVRSATEKRKQREAG